MTGKAAIIPACGIPPANVSRVPQRSPLRYPGGKTWAIPHARAWLGAGRDRLLIEPFAGGATVSLAAVMEGLAPRTLMVERDADIAAFWKAALYHGPDLCERVRAFQPCMTAVRDLARAEPRDTVGRGFRTLVLNRTRRGGIVAPGASFVRKGENGAGVASRWYPGTLCRRIEAISAAAGHIEFREADGLAVLEEKLDRQEEEMAVFVDPPYTGRGGKRAGRRLYACNDVDHARLFALLADRRADFLMTYDVSDEILGLVCRHGFHAVRVTMRNAHHAGVDELLVTRRPARWASGGG